MTVDGPPSALDSEPTLPSGQDIALPSFSLDDLNGPFTDLVSRLTDEEEDALLRVHIFLPTHDFLVLKQKNLNRIQQVVSLTGSPVLFVESFNY